MGGKRKWRKFGKKFLIMKIMMFQIWGKLEILKGGQNNVFSLSRMWTYF